MKDFDKSSFKDISPAYIKEFMQYSQHIAKNFTDRSLELNDK